MTSFASESSAFSAKIGHSRVDPKAVSGECWDSLLGNKTVSVQGELVSETFSPKKSVDFHDIEGIIPTLAEVGCEEDDGNCNICQEFVFEAAISCKRDSTLCCY